MEKQNIISDEKKPAGYFFNLGRYSPRVQRLTPPAGDFYFYG
jgi:hypothetical protein